MKVNQAKTSLAPEANWLHVGRSRLSHSIKHALSQTQGTLLGLKQQHVWQRASSPGKIWHLVFTGIQNKQEIPPESHTTETYTRPDREQQAPAWAGYQERESPLSALTSSCIC